MKTVYELFRDMETNIEKMAILTDKESLTFGELIKKSAMLAKGLQEYIKPGETISVWLPNSIDWIVTELAAGLIGATIVPLNMRYKSHELTYILNHSKSRMLIFQPMLDSYDYVEVLQNVLSNKEDSLPFLKYVFSNEKIENNTHFEIGHLNVLYKDWNGDLSEFKKTSNNPKQIYNMLYTSGTTSNPKGVMLSQKTVIYHPYNAGLHLGIKKDDIVLGTLPFCGIFGFNTLFMALSHGVSIVPVDRYQPERILQLIEKHQCTIFNGVDGMFTPLKNKNNYDLSSIRIGAIAIFTSKYKEFIQSTAFTFKNMVVVQPYGMTEVGSMVFVGDPNESLENRSLAGGILVSPEIQVEIIDSETEHVLSDGVEGEIAIKGYNVMQGYFENVEKTNASFTKDGKFKTGDLGVKNKNGSIIYKGRITESFRLKGFLVSPKEIEDYLCMMEEINIAQVVQVEYKGKLKLVAFLKLNAGCKVSEEQVLDYCKRGLADFKHPQTIYQVTNFPTTAGSNGEKIQKNKLREIALINLENKRVIEKI